ncbi:MAG TPA: phage tail tape measure protein [Kouleothrix sp.]|uniref:phage tail tape measure protein n=1 Tax=Kouleothrix sp. TaxID=2779161 RepID=UPI002CC3B8CC|nr:phage tail tape measure protein [Kouleothrix sp.]
MTLELSGVRLVAENAAEFFATMRRGDAAMASFAQATGRASADAAAFARATQQIKLDTLNNQLRDQQTRLGILKQQLAETAAKYGEASTQAQAKAAAVARLGGQVSITEQKIALLAQQMAAEADAAGEGTRTNHQLGQSLGDVEAGAGQAESALQRIATGALHKIGALGVEAFGKLLNAAKQFVSESLHGLADYETAMAVLQANSGASADQMARVASTAKDLGRDLTLPSTSAGSAAAAMNTLVQAGLNVEDAMAGAKGALQLAAAGQIADAEAAEYTAAALNQFKLSGDQAVRVADLMAASVGAAGSKVQQTGQAVQQAGASFAAAHIPIEVLITSIDLMAKAGIKGSDAGTSLKTMLTRLQSPTSDAAATMQQLGIEIYDSQGAMRPMRDIIGQFSQALSGLSQLNRANAINTIFGSDAQRAANIVLAGGVDAYDKMLAAVTKQGAAANQASAQMAGLGGAVKGLGSQLETLGLNALEPLSPLMTGVVQSAADLAGQLSDLAGPAMRGVISGATAMARIFVDVGVPAVSGLSTALLAYAATSIPAAIAAIPGLIAQVVAATTAFLAQAAAVAAALGPFALLGIAVGAMVANYRALQQQISQIAEQITVQRQEYQNTQTVLERYNQAQGYAKQATQGQVDALQKLRDEQQGHIQKLAELQAKEINYQGSSRNTLALRQQHAEAVRVEQAEIARLGGAITDQANKLDAAITSYDEVHLRSTDAIEDARLLRDGVSQLGQAAAVSTEDQIRLADEAGKVFQKGVEALSAFVASATTFMATTEANQQTHNQRMQALQQELEGARTEAQRQGIQERITAEQEGYNQQQQAAAQAYAMQAAAQRQALGEQLIAYIENQRQMHAITDEQASALTETTIQHFGVARDSTAVLFSDMARSVRDFGSGAIGSVGEVANAWGNAEDKAVSLKQKADALIAKYTMELVADMDKPGANIDAIRKKLADIPARVYSEVIITEKRYTSGAGDHVEGGGISGTRASGGPVALAKAYLVGEKGPEVFVPNSNGYIIPNHQLRGVRADGGAVQGHAMSAATMLGMPARFGGGPGYAMPWTTPAMGGPVTTTYQDNRQYTMPVYTNNSPGVLQQGYYTMRAQIL